MLISVLTDIEGHVSLTEPRSQGPRQQSQAVHPELQLIKGSEAHFVNRILFEFHRNENAKKPQSIHATYLISGIQKPPETATNGHANDEDEIVQSSPYLPSSMPNPDDTTETTRIFSIILAREEDLAGSSCLDRCPRDSYADSGLSIRC